jgi:hypothetical protein
MKRREGKGEREGDGWGGRRRGANDEERERGADGEEKGGSEVGLQRVRAMEVE